MQRTQEFELIKSLIKKYYPQAICGLFDSRNVVGDSMDNLYTRTYFDLDICYGWSYFEVFGTTTEEFNELCKLYNEMVGDAE